MGMSMGMSMGMGMGVGMDVSAMVFFLLHVACTPLRSSSNSSTLFIYALSVTRQENQPPGLTTKDPLAPALAAYGGRLR